jgi:hypothetical protein
VYWAQRSTMSGERFRSGKHRRAGFFVSPVSDGREAERERHRANKNQIAIFVFGVTAKDFPHGVLRREKRASLFANDIPEKPPQFVRRVPDLGEPEQGHSQAADRSKVGSVGMRLGKILRTTPQAVTGYQKNIRQISRWWPPASDHTSDRLVRRLMGVEYFEEEHGCRFRLGAFSCEIPQSVHEFCTKQPQTK